jgi:hypothetical protein
MAGMWHVATLHEAIFAATCNAIRIPSHVISEKYSRKKILSIAHILL